jgi:hypothetical protein
MHPEKGPSKAGNPLLKTVLIFEAAGFPGYTFTA